MPTCPLPENANLEHLKNQAKLVRDLIRSGDSGALSMVDEFHPSLDSSIPDALTRFKLSDAQLIVARMYRCGDWKDLRQHLKEVTNFNFTPRSEKRDFDFEAEPFVALACLHYGSTGPNTHERLERAHQLLAANPTLATESIEALATVGAHEELAARLDRDPRLVTKPCGPNSWPPLLYATYSRIEHSRIESSRTEPSALKTEHSDWSAVETVKVLLARGAGPNAGFLWQGLVPPFTALTGTFGNGENGEPRHPDRFTIARLLLEAGADPNDGQALYNNGIGGENHDDPRHLRLLYEYGLGTPQDGPWYERVGNQLLDPADLLYHELEAAAWRGRPNQMEFLIEIGLDLDRPVGRSQQTPARLAAKQGHAEVLQLLADQGIDVRLSPSDQFLSHVRSGNGNELKKMLADSNFADTARTDHSDAAKAVATSAISVLPILVANGFDIDKRSGGSGTSALHEAAQSNDVALAEALIENGADPNIRDTFVYATPLDWAKYSRAHAVADYLEPLTKSD